jgi:DNA-binding XRE family transcriptional regulator
VARQAVARLGRKEKTGRFTNDMHPKRLEELKADLASNLKVIRKAKGLAQERLALDAGVDRTVVSKIERGVTNPSLEILLRLANHLRCSGWAIAFATR